MEGIKEVRELDDVRTHWVAEVAGKREEWDAEITEQRPDELVAWRSTSGIPNAGVVTFDRLGDAQTRVTVEIEHDTNGIAEKIGSHTRRRRPARERRPRALPRHDQQRGSATGAWRGEIDETGGTTRGGGIDSRVGLDRTRSSSNTGPRRRRRRGPTVRRSGWPGPSRAGHTTSSRSSHPAGWHSAKARRGRRRRGR